MKELTLKDALDAYTKDLIPTVLELLELAGCEPKLCTLVKSSMWNQKDASLNKLTDCKLKSKEASNAYQEHYPKNYRN